jgi:dihydrofolate reductase
MRKIVVTNLLTLDGVMQAPGRPDEDRRGGFEYGGWAQAYNDEVMAREMGQGMAGGGDLLFGRRTYEDFYKVWANRTDNPFSEVLSKSQKYVASTSLEAPLPWGNSTLLKGDAAKAVAKLKEKRGNDIGVLGSGELLQTLMEHKLIDEYVLLIHPLVLGSGQRMFRDEAARMQLELVRSVPTTKGVIIATYRPA